MPHFQHFPESPSTMRALALPEPNAAMALSELSVPVPIPKDNELLIKVEYVGLNHIDAIFAQQGFCNWYYPHVLGHDAVGVVVQVNKGIFPCIGARVVWHASLGGQGVLSEYTTVPNYAVSVVPANVSAADAATLPCSGMTALIALDKLEINEGDSLFIDAGASGVGQFAIQFAKQQGATVFTTASKHNHKLLKQLGADVVFDYKDSKLETKIRHELGPQGFDAVLDCMGGDTTIRNVELMRFCGRIACLNELPQFEQELMFRKAPNIGIVSLGGAWLANSLCAQQKLCFMGNLLLESVARGEVKLPQIHSVDFTAEAVSTALTKQLAGGFMGKQVVQVSG